MKTIDPEILLGFMAEYGRAYMANGGPTSRLEEDLSRLGRKLEHPTEVYATPTGVFVSCVDSQGKNHTALSRVRDSGMDLEKLCWLEGVLARIASKKLSIQEANRMLLSKQPFQSIYTLWLAVFTSFIAGFALSFTAFAKPVPALISGLITMATWWVAGPGLKSRISSSIFRDFLGCLVTLSLAAGARFVWHAPFETFSIGGLILLVPGLSLTTAISDLADQNLVSGTAKLMQAILTLLALGLAYRLFSDFASRIEVTAPLATAKRYPISFLVSLLGMALSITCFGILFKVPPKTLPFATLTGLLGWFAIKQFSGEDSIATAAYLASTVVGIASLTLGHFFRMPSQVFSVPGILAMLPGMLALTSFNSFILGQGTSGEGLAMRVLLTTGGIVFGLFTARIPFAFRPNREK